MAVVERVGFFPPDGYAVAHVDAFVPGRRCRGAHPRAADVPLRVRGHSRSVGFLALLGVLWFFRGAAQKIAAGGGPHGGEYHGEGQAGRAAQADQQGSHH